MSRTCLLRQIVIGSLAVVTAPVLAGDWSPTNGPAGGSVRAFTSAGATQLAGAHGAGVFRSTDGGSTWRPANDGLPVATSVTALLAVDGMFLAGTAEYGVFRSMDDGVSWLPVSEGLPDLQILTLTARAADILALVGSDIGADLHVTEDLGATWQLLPAPTGLKSIFAHQDLLLGDSSIGAGLLRSVDGGQNWDFLASSPAAGLHSFAALGGSVFAGGIGSNADLYRTDDSAETWISANAGLPADAAIRALGTRESSLFAVSTAGVYRSIDSGANWQSAMSGLDMLRAADFNTFGVAGSSIFIGTERGLFGSTNDGAAWSESNAGLVATRIQNLTILEDSLFATVANQPLGQFSIEPHALDSVFRYESAASSWTALRADLPDAVIPRALLAADGALYLGTQRHGVFRSDNRGDSWQPARAGLPYSSGSGEPIYYEVARLISNGDNLFAGIQPFSIFSSHGSARPRGGGVYRSDNGGQTWIEASAGLPLLGEHNPPHSFLHRPRITGLGAAEGVMLVGTYIYGVFRSTDGGASWTEANAGLPQNAQQYFPQISSFIELDGVVYAASLGFHAGGSEGVGVFRSLDGGLTWSPAGPPPGVNRPVTALAIAAEAPGRLFAAAGCPGQPVEFGGCTPGAGDGVYASDNGGETWTLVGAALADLPVTALATDGDVLYAGTMTAGAWRFQLHGFAIGDLNCDGAISNFDIDPFVLALTDAGGYAGAFPNCDAENADINQDGVVNNFDIDPFVELLIGG